MTQETELTCREFVEIVTDYLEGAMTEGDRRRFEDHLQACEGCTTYLDQIRTTIRTVGRLDEEHLEPDVRDRLLGAFRDWKRRT